MAMMKSILSIAYAVSLFGNVAPQAAETNPFQAVAEEQARQSVMAARHLIRAELEQAMRVSLEPVEWSALPATLSGEAAHRELPLASITAGK
jgi:hypothetical protein